MKKDLSTDYKLSELILLNLQGGGAPEQFQQLKQWLQSDPEAIEFYVEYMMHYSALTQPGTISIADLPEETTPPVLDASLWTALSEFENKAEAVEVQKEHDKSEPTQKVIHKTSPRQLSKSRILTAILSTAALILILVYAHFVPHSASIEVATVTEDLDVKWVAPGFSFREGERVLTNELMILSAGIIQIQTDRGVTLTIEGPAEFEFTKLADLDLHYGRVYARVKPQGIGFTISTANSRVIDLGTEFGIHAQKDGPTELHVLKGKTTLVSGSSWLDKTSQNIAQDRARYISADGSHVKSIPVKKETFARAINSKSNTVWRGQNTIDLADVICGGNGFGTGSKEIVLDPVSGKLLPKRQAENHRNKVPMEVKYVPVSQAEYIDGVFMPNGQDGPIQVSSQNHYHETCPPTTGVFNHYISNGPFNWDTLMVIREDGYSINVAREQSIYMHPNLGITFDLQKIRNNMPDSLNITGFDALCARDLMNPEFKGTKAGFMILLDGKQKFYDLTLGQGQSTPINLSLQPADRFLTLITVDLNNKKYRSNRTYYLNPQLLLEEVEK